MNLLGLGALGLVAVEWLALGTLSGVAWPSHQSTVWATRWGLRLLVGAALIAGVQLVLAQLGIGFGSIPLVLGCAAVGAGVLRLLGRDGVCQEDKPVPTSNGERLGDRKSVV